jgi:Uma2 family endonuclease
VICGEPEFYEGRNDTVTNPLVIVEILSDSIKNYDRGEKFKFYRTLPSLREYVLIDQYSMHVEQFAREETGKWILTEYQGAAAVLKFSSIGFEVAFRELYEHVKFK